MKISFIIRCHNEEEHIGRLLSGIMQQTLEASEIILVDSGSTDATLSIASRFPIRILHIAPDEFSFGRSLNLGCAAAGGDCLVLASAHVYPVYRDWLAKLTSPFENEKIALVYGKQRGDRNTRFSEHKVFARWFPEQADPNQQHTFCNNANAAIRRSVWEALPYDESLTGLEDIEWAKRAKQAGYDLAYVADAEVIHVHNETPRMIYNRYRREAIAMKTIYPEQRFTLFDFGRFFTGNAVSDSYHALHDRMLWKNLRSIFLFRMMQFWGTYRGYTQQGPVTKRLKETFYYADGWTRPQTGQDPTDSRGRIDYSELDEG